MSIQRRRKTGKKTATITW